MLLTAGVAILAWPMYRSAIFGPVSTALSLVTLAFAIWLIVTVIEPLPEHLTVYSAIVWVAWGSWRLFRAAAGSAA